MNSSLSLLLLFHIFSRWKYYVWASLLTVVYVNSSSQVNGRPDHKVYFYDIEMDTLTHFDFFSGRPSSGTSQSEESER